MRIGIIGSGHIGGTAARLFAQAGHEIALSHAGPPDTLREQVEKLGQRACAMTPTEACRFGEVVLLALPWRERGSLPIAELNGKIVIDATNPYRPDFSLYDLGDSTSSEEVLKVIAGARLVKAFNTLHAADLATSGRTDLPLDRRIALFVAGDEEESKRVVAQLIDDIGFSAVFTGTLRAGGKLQEPGSPLYGRAFTAQEAGEALGMAQSAAFEAAAAFDGQPST